MAFFKKFWAFLTLLAPRPRAPRPANVPQNSESDVRAKEGTSSFEALMHFPFEPPSHFSFEAAAA